MTDEDRPRLPPGLSLYEYYAGQALAGLLASGKYGPNDTPLVIREAYRLAHAMLRPKDPPTADVPPPPSETASLNDRLKWCVAVLESSLHQIRERKEPTA